MSDRERHRELREVREQGQSQAGPESESYLKKRNRNDSEDDDSEERHRNSNKYKNYEDDEYDRRDKHDRRERERERERDRGYYKDRGDHHKTKHRDRDYRERERERERDRERDREKYKEKDHKSREYRDSRDKNNDYHDSYSRNSKYEQPSKKILSEDPHNKDTKRTSKFSLYPKPEDGVRNLSSGGSGGARTGTEIIQMPEIPDIRDIRDIRDIPYISSNSSQSAIKNEAMSIKNEYFKENVSISANTEVKNNSIPDVKLNYNSTNTNLLLHQQHSNLNVLQKEKSSANFSNYNLNSNVIANTNNGAGLSAGVLNNNYSHNYSHNYNHNIANVTVQITKPQMKLSQSNSFLNSSENIHNNFTTSSASSTSIITSPTKIQANSGNFSNQMMSQKDNTQFFGQNNFNRNDIRIPKLNTIGNSHTSHISDTSHTSHSQALNGINAQVTYPYKSLELYSTEVNVEKHIPVPQPPQVPQASQLEDKYSLNLNSLTMLIANKGENQKRLVSKLEKEYCYNLDDWLNKEKEKFSSCFNPQYFSNSESEPKIKEETKILDPLKIPIIYIEESKYLSQVNASYEYKSRGLKAEIAHFKRKIEKEARDASVQGTHGTHGTHGTQGAQGAQGTAPQIKSLRERIEKLDLDLEILKIQQKEIRVNLDEIFSDF